MNKKYNSSIFCTKIVLSFKGRISANTYWKYQALLLPISILTSILYNEIPDDIYDFLLSYGENGEYISFIFSITPLIMAIPLILLSLSADIRRFHDFNLSGWFVLPYWVVLGALDFCIESFNFYPVAIILLSVISATIISLIPPTDGINKYGENSDIL